MIEQEAQENAEEVDVSDDLWLYEDDMHAHSEPSSLLRMRKS